MIDQTDLFTSGTNDYHTYRIPALVVTTAGTILAVCEARKDSALDDADVDLAVKRSTDGGKSWSEMQIIVDHGDHTMGNHCPVVDDSSGTIWLPLCRDNQRILLVSSTDDGLTWCEPVDISEQVMEAEWPWIGAGPGHGIQLESGRLLIPCWSGKGEGYCGDTQISFAIFSDDGGNSWKRGTYLDHDASDECEAVELVDGSVCMNVRSRYHTNKRGQSFSHDGGQTWSAIEFAASLPEPSCQASIVRFTRTPRFPKNRLLFCSPADVAQRACLTVRMSYDECASWPTSKVLYPGSAAYSNLAVTRDALVLCLYEADDYQRLALAQFDLDWLTDGTDSLND